MTTTTRHSIFVPWIFKFWGLKRMSLILEEMSPTILVLFLCVPFKVVENSFIYGCIGQTKVKPVFFLSLRKCEHRGSVRGEDVPCWRHIKLVWAQLSGTVNFGKRDKKKLVCLTLYVSRIPQSFSFPCSSFVFDIRKEKFAASPDLQPRFLTFSAVSMRLGPIQKASAQIFWNNKRKEQKKSLLLMNTMRFGMIIAHDELVVYCFTFAILFFFASF